MKNSINRFRYLLAAMALVLVVASSCEGEISILDYDDYYTDKDTYDIAEQMVLDKWIEENADSLIDNRHENGFYIYNKTVVTDGTMLTEDDYWVRYSIVSRDLDGNICLTREEEWAQIEGTFTYYTHYAPLKREVDDESIEAIDIILLSSGLDVGGVATNFYEGSEFVIIAPSYWSGSDYNGVGGYAGQFLLEPNRPIISEITIVDIISDIEEYESEQVTKFISSNGSFTWDEVMIEDEDLGEGFTSVADGLYVNYEYTPQAMTYINDYSYGSSRNVADLAEFNDSIAELLIERFGEGVSTGDVITESNSANVWYIARMLDGFVIDSNIEEVRALAFNDTENETTAVSYQADTDADSYLDMWYHTIPNMTYGSWNVVIGVSDYGYSDSSRTDDGSSCEIQAYTPLIFEIYIEEEDED